MLLVVECDVSGSGRDHDALVVRMLLVVECGLRRMGPVESDADELIYSWLTGGLTGQAEFIRHSPSRALTM